MSLAVVVIDNYAKVTWIGFHDIKFLYGYIPTHLKCTFLITIHDSIQDITFYIDEGRITVATDPPKHRILFQPPFECHSDDNIVHPQLQQVCPLCVYSLEDNQVPELLLIDRMQMKLADKY